MERADETAVLYSSITGYSLHSRVIQLFIFDKVYHYDSYESNKANNISNITNDNDNIVKATGTKIIEKITYPKTN